MFAFILFIFGLFIGSFLGVLVDRIPKNKSFIKGRSYCSNCKHVLNFLDLIPVISFAMLKGKCRYCKAKLSLFYPTIEITTGILFALTFFYFGISLSTIYFLIITSGLIVIFFTDLEYGIIPNKVVFPTLVISVVYFLLINTPLLIVNLATGFGASMFFIIIAGIFFLLTKKESIGGGDIKFVFLMGLVLGFPSIIVALYIAFLTGAIVSIILILWKKKRYSKDSIPFGPFLVLATFLSIFWGNIIWETALKAMGLL